MTMEEKVRDILAQYLNDEVMLDAFFQWAKGQFRRKGEGKHAWAQEKAYGYFLNNLRLRYGLSATDAKGIGTRLEEASKTLAEGSYEFELKNIIIAALSGPAGDTLRKNVQIKVDKASVSARGLLAVYNWLGGIPEYQGAMSSTAWAGPLEALYRVTFGTLPGSEVKSFATARDELISCGVINKSFYESGTGKTSYDEYLPGILVPQVDLTSVAPTVDGNSISTYLQALFTRQAFEQARILEEVALQGVITTYYYYGPTGELPEEVIPHRGLFAYVDAERGKVAAVNPLGREILLKNILELKIERLKNPASAIETALEQFRDQAWPESDLTRLSDKPDRRVWRLDQIRAPRLFIFIGNWLSESDLGTIRNLGAEPLQDAFIFTLTDQSLPSVEKVIANSLKMWRKASIAVITPTPKGMASHQLQGTAHPSLSRILELLGVQPPPPPTKYRVEIKVTDNAGAALSSAQVNIGTMSANTLEDGRAVFEVSAGTYVLTTTAKGYEPFSENITIAKNEQKTVQLQRIAGKEFNVVVSVKDQASQPLHGVSVNFGPSIAVTTGSNGTATLNIGSGKYEVRISKAGYNTVGETIEVTRDITKEFILKKQAELPPPSELRVLLGVHGSEKIFWCPANERSWNFAIVGSAGTGKTQTVKSVLNEFAKQDIPYIVFDFRNDYVPVKSLSSDFGSVLDLGNISINPLELDGSCSPRDQKYQVSDIIDLVYAIGERQIGYIRDAIKLSYEGKGIQEDDEGSWKQAPSTFTDIQQNLERLAEEGGRAEKESIKGIFARLDPIFDYGIFSAKTVMPFEDLVKRHTIINLGILPNDNLKAVVCEFLLRKLRYFLYGLAESREPRLFTVIDEAHRLKYEKSSSTGQLLKEARKYGVGLLLSTQDPVDFPDLVYNNIGGILSLQLTDPKYAKAIAEHLGGKVNWQSVKNELSEKFAAFVKFSGQSEVIRLKVIPYYQRNIKI